MMQKEVKWGHLTWKSLLEEAKLRLKVPAKTTEQLST